MSIAVQGRVLPPRLQATRGSLWAMAAAGEWAFAVYCVLVFAGVPFAFVDRGAPFLAPAFAGTAALSLIRPSATWRTLRRDPLTLALLALVLASPLWSIDPQLSLKRGIMLAAASVFGVYLATRFTMRQLLVLLGASYALVGVASLALALAVPSIGVMGGGHAGNWQGVFTHKNLLGRHMAVALVAFLLLAREYAGRSGPRTLAWLGAALSLLLVVQSRSMTSIVAAAAMLVLLPLLAGLRAGGGRRMLALLGILAVLSTAGLVLYGFSADVLVLVGKDPSLTDRVPLWRFLLDQIAARPWLGYGYGAYWTGWNGPSLEIMRVTGGWYPGEAHNGFLDLALQVGAGGVILFVAGYLNAVRRALGRLASGSLGDALWPVLLLAFLLLTSVTEAVFLRYNDLFWVLYVATVFLPRPSGAVRMGAPGLAELTGARGTLGVRRPAAAR